MRCDQNSWKKLLLFFFFSFSSFSFHSLDVFSGIWRDSLACEHEACRASQLTEEKSKQVSAPVVLYEHFARDFYLRGFTFVCQSGSQRRKSSLGTLRGAQLNGGNVDGVRFYTRSVTENGPQSCSWNTHDWTLQPWLCSAAAEAARHPIGGT